jgi:tetratricopeptide (TPR) repeat protein
MKHLLFLSILCSLIVFNNCSTDSAEDYYDKGIIKGGLKDYYGAISDFNKVIEIDPNSALAYFHRGGTKVNINDLSGACSDWQKAVDLGNTDAAKLVSNYCN